MQKLLLYITILATIFTACQKEKSLEGGNTPDNIGGGNNNGGNDPGSVSETGTWKFINMHISNNGSIETNSTGVPMITKVSTDFITTNNSGTVAFDGKNMTFNNVAYNMEGILKAVIYISGIKTTSQDLPFTYDYPAATAAYDYKKVSTDSLYFPAAFVSGISATGVIQTGPAGAKLKWDGNKMTITMVVEENRAGNFQGMMAKIINKATIVTTLQKQ